MKKNLWTIVAVFAVVLCLGSTTIFAATKASSYSTVTSNNESTSTKYPSNKQVKKILGYSAKTIKKFSNGFTFKNFNTSKASAFDKNNKEIGSYKQLQISYTKDNDKIILIICKQLESENDDEGTKLTYKNIELRYIAKYKTIAWKDNGINYSILADCNLTKDTLLKMAKEIIKKK